MVFVRMSEDMDIHESDLGNQYGIYLNSTQTAIEQSVMEENKSKSIELVHCREDTFNCCDEFDCQKTESKLLGQSMVEEFGLEGEVSPAYMSVDSNQDQKRPDVHDCKENAKMEVMEFPSVNEVTSSAVKSSAEPLKEIQDWSQNPQIQDHVGTSHTIEASTGDILKDPNIDQNNLPLKHCGMSSNRTITLPSENKDTTTQVDNSVDPPSDMLDNHDLKQLKETHLEENPSQPLEQMSEDNKKVDGTPGDTSENAFQEFREMHTNSNENPSQLGCGDKSHTGQSRKRKSAMKSPISSTRVLRSRTQESKSVETINASAVDTSNKEKKIKKGKRKQRKEIAANEFTGIRARLKYILGRIKYEQSLIDAYSGEGWKGQSLEKLKPEQELQRAKSGIFHYKLKIRDLFSHIDASLSQGKFPESLFDSEGQIDSEDIFCAKCSSIDLTADNDIILCDGACERGFHQMCLDPPLLKEDIPPDDEGWLCPGCDCKVDCVDLLNDLLGTDLSITDSWEKVFLEEATAAASGKQLDDIYGLPSDDSEDDDYHPDNPQVDENVSQEDESKSDDESDSSDTSFELETPNDELLLGLPSEDSEDDDYEPDAPECNSEQVMHDSSSSDFTSDSEDFGLVLQNNTSPSQEDQSKRNKVGGGTHSLKCEVDFLLQSDDALASGKRHVERLDYKKLHDEAYGMSSSDSSDEDYQDSPALKCRNQRTDKATLKEIDQTPVDASAKNANRSSSMKLKDESLVASECGSSSKKNTNQRYGEAVIKRLSESFKEHHYPTREEKESLARESGLTYQQVDKWFVNARWFYRNPKSRKKRATPAAEDRLDVGVEVLQETGGEKHITNPESKPKSDTADLEASNQSSSIQKPMKNKTQLDMKKNSQPGRRSNRLKA
ncbi:unnamed protein product [Cuscuta epithymum]|uniref:Uncharacterized protein n=2 Tax=Cuscuta epithymum TaxID=186058 RepID=A0AAV0D1V7_9ASTE|nr:unnamed protein product [Cuscuta epithymum]